MNDELKRRAENQEIGLILSKDQTKSERRKAFFQAIKNAQEKKTH